MSRPANHPRPTTTSYLLLAQLALRPWSAYELAVQRTRYFRLVWPRASRAIYAELKRLAASGLASAETGRTGRRTRTIYSLTPSGRAVLDDWLELPVTPISLEFEGLQRVFSAPLGSKEQLLTALAQVRHDVATIVEFNDSVIAEYVEGRAPFQRDAHIRTLVVDFFTQFLDVAEKWVERTTAEVEAWDDLEPDGKPLHALERLRRQRYDRASGQGGA